VVNGTITANVNIPATLDIPVAGIYLFMFNITLNCGGAYQTWGNMQIGGVNTGINQSHPCTVVNSSNSVGSSGSIVINATASQYSVTFSGSSTAYSVSLTYSFFKAIRIA